MCIGQIVSKKVITQYYLILVNRKSKTVSACIRLYKITWKCVIGKESWMLCVYTCMQFSPFFFSGTYSVCLNNDNLYDWTIKIMRCGCLLLTAFLLAMLCLFFSLCPFYFIPCYIVIHQHKDPENKFMLIFNVESCNSVKIMIAPSFQRARLFMFKS